MTATPYPVVHLPADHRFQAEVDGHLCVLLYYIKDGVMVTTTTRVPAELEGRGIGGAIVAEAMQWAQAQGLRVRPACSFVAAWLHRHPEYSGLAV